MERRDQYIINDYIKEEKIYLNIINKDDEILFKDYLSRGTAPNLTIPTQAPLVKITQEKTSGVDLNDFLDQSLGTSSSTEQITKERDSTRMQVDDLIPEISLSFEDKTIEKEVGNIIKKLLNVKKLDFYKEDFDDFIKTFDKLFIKLKSNKNSSDYKKILALKVFFLHLRKVYEYLSLTLFDIVKSKNKDIFDKDLILNTIKRKLNIDVTNSEYEDLKKVFESLKTLITLHITDIVDLVFANINDNYKLHTELGTKYPNLATISEIKRIINNEKTTSLNSADGQLKEIEEKDFQAEVLNSDIPVIVDFYGSSCPPCKSLQPKLESLAKKYIGKVKFVKIDVSKPTSVAGKYNVSSTPTVIAFNKGKNFGTSIVGNNAVSGYEKLIDEVIKEYEKDPSDEGKMFPKPDIEGKEYIINGVDFSDPKSIVDYLNIYATGQEHAKEVLAVAFSRFVTQGIVTSQLIVGPSGSGKTYMTNILCNLTGFKFVNIGISNLSSAGIKGTNLKEQLETLKGHKGKAILFLDEIDKLADSNNPHGQGLQNELLTLFNTDSPAQEYEGIDLKNIMIIGAGAFEDNGKGKSLYAMLKKKAGNKANVFETLDDGDLIDYGLKPEIVGRLNGKTYLNPLTVEQLYDMMTKKGSETAKLVKELEEYHIDIIFTDEALLEIARVAHAGVGARAIKSIFEKIMKPISVRKVELAGKTVEINKETVEKILETSNSAEKDIDWNDTKTIIAYLDRFVPGNIHAKRALANSFKDFMIHGKLSHTFIYGESGAGKTYMISLLCKAAGIQMGEGSLANVVSEGFKGNSLSDIIKGSFSKGYMGKSPKKVLFLDEIDKLINRKMGRDGVGGGFGGDIENELLNIFNGGSDYGVDLSNCLIISAGACAGNSAGESLKELVQKRLGGSNKIDDNSLLEQVEKEDLEAYGFKTELVGRFKRVSFLEAVTKDYLRQVMFSSEGSAYKKKLIEAQNEGYNLKFNDESIDSILEEAENMRTGVRALETVLNRLFDKIYEDFAKGDVEIDGEYTDKVLNPKTKFEHPDMDKINWSTPQTVKLYLDTKVQGNELYKQSLSLLFWKLKRKIDTGNDKIKIPNLLVLGPSGGGKTHGLKTLAPLLGIPFAETNIATVEANYPREKIGDVFSKIGNSVDIAIIFIDEIDKILMNPSHPLNNEVMSYLEGGNYEGRLLKNFVFVGAGAFQGYNVTDDDGNVSLKTLQDIGVKPEVLGRFGSITGIEKMDIEKMTAIIKSENSVFNQRIKSIQDEYGIGVILEEGVLEYICEIAIKQPTGARALDLITNLLFTGFEFNIGEYLDGGEIKLDMDNTRKLLESLNY